MSRKLGEILVQGKLLSPADLKRALDAQLIFGGRLGTNLLELGFLDDEALSKALKEQKRVDVASQEMVDHASKEAVRMVPAKIADRHKVIPLQAAPKKLKVAMLDPTDLIALDEVAFVTGCQIIPYIAPEARILEALERLYGIPRPMRYIKLSAVEPHGEAPAASLSDAALTAQYTSGVLDVGAARGPQPQVGSPPGSSRPSAPHEVSPQGERVLSLAELLGAAVEPTPAASPWAPAPATPAGPAAPVAPPAAAAAPAARVSDDQLQAVLEEARRRKEAEIAAAAAQPAATLEDASRMLAEAETREEIGDALLAFARGQFARVMTFVVQKDRALGWLALLPGQSAESARQHARSVVLPLDQPSVLQAVAEGGQYYMGELPARPADQLLASALADPRPQNLVILPVKVSDKVVIALHGDNGAQPLGSFDMRSLRALCQKASMAMEVLLLRARIRQLG
jgi:hypothetical protein